MTLHCRSIRVLVCTRRPRAIRKVIQSNSSRGRVEGTLSACCRLTDDNKGRDVTRNCKQCKWPRASRLNFWRQWIGVKDVAKTIACASKCQKQFFFIVPDSVISRDCFYAWLNLPSFVEWRNFNTGPAMRSTLINMFRCFGTFRRAPPDIISNIIIGVTVTMYRHSFANVWKG